MLLKRIISDKALGVGAVISVFFLLLAAFDLIGVSPSWETGLLFFFGIVLSIFFLLLGLGAVLFPIILAWRVIAEYRTKDGNQFSNPSVEGISHIAAWGVFISPLFLVVFYVPLFFQSIIIEYVAARSSYEIGAIIIKTIKTISYLPVMTYFMSAFIVGTRAIIRKPNAQ